MAFLWFVITAMASATVCLIAYVLWREHPPHDLGAWRRDEYDWTAIRFEGPGQGRTESFRTAPRRPRQP